jgi:hypothetical protein
MPQTYIVAVPAVLLPAPGPPDGAENPGSGGTQGSAERRAES